MIRYVIFDLDGTLLDTLDDLADSMNHVLAANGFPERTVDEVRRFVGNGVKRLVSLAIPAPESGWDFGTETREEVTERLFSEMSRYYADHCEEKTKPYDGILSMLAELKEAGIHLAVVSNKIDLAVKELNEKYFGDLLEEAMGEKPGIRRKPAPDMVLAVMKELGADPADTIYVGDSEVDIETARNTGVPCISVTWGFRPEEELIAAGAEHLVRTPEELVKLTVHNLREEI